MKNFRLIALVIILSFNTFAAENISYSGRLVTPAGTPVVGPVNMKFDIVVDSDIKCTLTKSSVPLSNGVFNVSLDYGTTCNQFDGTLSKTIEAAYYNDKIPYIRVTDTTNTKTYPDQPIAAVPLAIHALTGGSDDGYNLDLEYTCADGEILKMNSSNLYECSTDLQGVTEVTAGSGLTGGSVTSTGTVAVDFGTSDGQVPAIASGKVALTLVPDLPGERITSGTIDEARLPNADASNNGKLTSTDWNTFNNKQDDLGTGSAGQYLAAGPAWADLVTAAIPEGTVPGLPPPNLYFTDARAKAATVANTISDGVTDVAPSQNAVFDALATKADASGDANIVADSITLDTQGAVNLEPYGGTAGDTSEIRFYELTGNGSNYTGFKSPDSLASNNIYTLPINGGTNNYVLSVLNSVTGQLGWVDVSTASQVSNIGDVIINADSDSNNTGEVVLQTKGTDRVVIDNDGKVGIGTATPSATRAEFYNSSTSTASGWESSLINTLDFNPGSTSASNYRSSLSTVNVQGPNEKDGTLFGLTGNAIQLGSGDSEQLIGSEGYVTQEGSGAINYASGVSAFASTGSSSTGNITYAQGSNSVVYHGSTASTIARAAGALGMTQNLSTGTITEGIGGLFAVQNSGGGTVTTGIGVKIEDVAGSTQYGLYQSSANDMNYFAGNVGIGVNPNEKLTVEGPLSLRESAAPSATANYGKLYVKADGKAYFKNDAGTEFDLTDNGDGGTVTSVATGTGLTGGPITTTGTISIANNGVTATQLADDAVDTAAIVDANVTTAKLANDAVTSAKLAAGAVDSTALGANSVSSSNIIDGTIVNADISGSAAIDYTKLDIANGEIPQAKVNNLTSDLAAKLPLAGGTMTGNIAMGDNDITGISSLGIDGATLGTITVQAPLSVTSYTWQFPSASGSNGQVLMTDGSGATSWTTIDTSNADTLDSIDSTGFLRSNTDDTYSGGTLVVQNTAGDEISLNGQRDTLQILQATANKDAFMTFHISGDYAAHFGLDGSTNDLAFGGWSAGAVKHKVWHAGNDGSGSGLDSDTLDGLNSAQFLRSDTNDSTSANLTVGGELYTNSWIRSNTSGYGWYHQAHGGGIYMTDNTWVRVYNNKNFWSSGTIQADTQMNSAAFLYTSDRRLKENITPLDDALNRVLNLDGKSFQWKKNGKHDIGFIAQEVEEEEPWLVETAPVSADGKMKNIKSVKYGNVVALLVEAIKELKVKIDSLFDFSDDNKREIASLKEENQELKRKLTKQEERLERLEKLIEKK